MHPESLVDYKWLVMLESTVPYFVGTVKDRCGDDCYIIQDSLGDLEKIWREDVIADDDGSNQTIRVSDIS